MLKRISLLVAVLALTSTSLAFAWGHDEDFAWQDTPTGSTASLRGLSAVNAKTVWASGSLGTVLRTVNRGATWAQVGPPGTDELQFRDIEAFDRNHAVILSIPSPTPTDSRVYVTSDAGAHWQLAFQNDDPNAFYDCMTFFDRRHGLALSDPVNGAFRIIATEDGGHSWRVLDPGHAAGAGGRVRVRGERPVPHILRKSPCLVRHGRRRRSARLPVERPWQELAGELHADAQRSRRGDFRACVPQPG